MCTCVCQRHIQRRANSRASQVETKSVAWRRHKRLSLCLQQIEIGSRWALFHIFLRQLGAFSIACKTLFCLSFSVVWLSFFFRSTRVISFIVWRARGWLWSPSKTGFHSQFIKRNEARLVNREKVSLTVDTLVERENGLFRWLSRSTNFFVRL